MPNLATHVKIQVNKGAVHLLLNPSIAPDFGTAVFRDTGSSLTLSRARQFQMLAVGPGAAMVVSGDLPSGRLLEWKVNAAPNPSSPAMCICTVVGNAIKSGPGSFGRTARLVW